MERAILLLPQFGFFLSAHQRILGARHDGNVGPANEFEHSQRVRDFFLQPPIAGHNGHPHHLSLRGLNQQ